MNYNKIVYSIILLFFVGFSQVQAQERDLDSVYNVKITPFLSKLIELKDLNATILQERMLEFKAK